MGVGSKHIARNFMEIMEDQGWRGLWAGNAINMIRIVPTQAIELATFEWVKRTVSSTKENWSQYGSPKLQIGHFNVDVSLSWVSPVAVGGAAAGIISTLVCHPLEVIKVSIIGALCSHFYGLYLLPFFLLRMICLRNYYRIV